MRALMGERVPWEAQADLEALRLTPVLVVSGGHAPGLEAVCDAIAEVTGGQRAVLPGARHGVHRLGAGFNNLLERFWLGS